MRQGMPLCWLQMIFGACNDSAVQNAKLCRPEKWGRSPRQEAFPIGKACRRLAPQWLCELCEVFHLGTCHSGLQYTARA
jgi:hypothetical protein